MDITKEEAKKLLKMPLEELMKEADLIREENCGNTFDLCTIINGKSGKCSEDCKFCAQSAHYQTEAEEYPLLSSEEILEGARYNQERGVLRYSIVTSGKALSDTEVDKVCRAIDLIKKETNIKVCGSFGLLNQKQYEKLKEAGLSRVHNNLETSKKFFPKVCTTHTFAEKVAAIKAAKAAGLSVCSGGIFGLGESMEDRIDMAFTLKELNIKSIPVNMLNPICGTPFDKNKVLSEEELCRIVAIYRHILPDASIRMAGGRGLLADKGRRLFQAGANAAISGDMLTTSGYTIETDMKMLKELGFEVELQHGE